MRSRHTLEVTLTLIGPLLTTGGETAEPGVDTPLAVDRFGRFMLPFSLVKGKFLDAVRDLRSSDFSLDTKSNRYLPQDSILADWLGRPSKHGDYDPERGLLHFSDFHTKQTGRPDNLIERIAIAPDSGAVQGRMLQVIQAPFTYGEEVVFEGTVEFFADDTEARQIQSLVELALRWTPAYGANRTVGFGRTKRVEVQLRGTPVRLVGTPSPGDVMPLELHLDRPICLVGQRHSRNHFESLETISGTVLKGAVAQMIREKLKIRNDDIASPSTATSFPNLRQCFDKIRFLEARPRSVNDAERPVEPPLSMVTCPVKEPGDPPYFDEAIESRPRLIRGAAPAFLPDWKDADVSAVREGFGWSTLPRERRTRTAIDPDRGRAADEQLFSYGLVQPDRTTLQGSREKFVWDSGLDLHAVDPKLRSDVVRELSAVLQWGIVGIGKTRAVGEFKWQSARPNPRVGSKPLPGKLVIVTLQTDCLMTNPATLQRTDLSNPLAEAYREFWQELSGGRLDQVRFFARQSLLGGHVSERAQRSSGYSYEPFLLTDRGSVFVLNITKDDVQARKLVAEWEEHGLPQPTWVPTRYVPPGSGAPLWRCCPYLRENGYGEIAVDLACHTDNHFAANKSAQGIPT